MSNEKGKESLLGDDSSRGSFCVKESVFPVTMTGYDFPILPGSSRFMFNRS